MQIEVTKLEEMNKLRVRGDVPIIAQNAGVQPGAIYRALETGKCGVAVYTALHEYFAKRKQLINYN
jgi:thiamine monophosphate synthase